MGAGTTADILDSVAYVDEKCAGMIAYFPQLATDEVLVRAYLDAAFQAGVVNGIQKSVQVLGE